MLNTVAGGGTFLTFLALVYTGVPMVAANATSAIAVFPGYLGRRRTENPYEEILVMADIMTKLAIKSNITKRQQAATQGRTRIFYY